MLRVAEAVLAAEAQRGARENDRRHLVEELRLERGADFDRRAGAVDAAADAFAADVEPVDLPLQALIEPGAQIVGQAAATIGGGLQLHLLFLLVDALHDAVDAGRALAELSGQGIGHAVRLAYAKGLA